MKRPRSTSPALYFERQTHAKDPVVLEYEYPANDFEQIAVILGAAVWAFAMGMLVVALWAGVL
jgi:hypothetical protein